MVGPKCARYFLDIENSSESSAYALPQRSGRKILRMLGKMPWRLLAHAVNAPCPSGLMWMFVYPQAVRVSSSDDELYRA